MPYLECFSEGLRESLQGFGQGSIIFVYDPEKDARYLFYNKYFFKLTFLNYYRTYR